MLFVENGEIQSFNLILGCCGHKMGELHGNGLGHIEYEMLGSLYSPQHLAHCLANTYIISCIK